jgi:hypothetical protein
VEAGIDVLEVPRVGGRVDDQANVGLGRDAADVLAHGLCERCIAFRIEQLEAADEQVGMLADRHARTPALPAPWTRPAVERRAEEADDDALPAHSLKSRY